LNCFGSCAFICPLVWAALAFCAELSTTAEFCRLSQVALDFSGCLNKCAKEMASPRTCAKEMSSPRKCAKGMVSRGIVRKKCKARGMCERNCKPEGMCERKAEPEEMCERNNKPRKCAKKMHSQSPKKCAKGMASPNKYAKEMSSRRQPPLRKFGNSRSKMGIANFIMGIARLAGSSENFQIPSRSKSVCLVRQVTDGQFSDS